MAVSRLSKVYCSHASLASVECDSLRNAIHFIPKNRCKQLKQREALPKYEKPDSEIFVKKGTRGF
jgi:hypothetical protein